MHGIVAVNNHLKQFIFHVKMLHFSLAIHTTALQCIHSMNSIMLLEDARWLTGGRVSSTFVLVFNLCVRMCHGSVETISSPPLSSLSRKDEL